MTDKDFIYQVKRQLDDNQNMFRRSTVEKLIAAYDSLADQFSTVSAQLERATIRLDQAEEANKKAQAQLNNTLFNLMEIDSQQTQIMEALAKVERNAAQPKPYLVSRDEVMRLMLDVKAYQYKQPQPAPMETYSMQPQSVTYYMVEYGGIDRAMPEAEVVSLAMEALVNGAIEGPAAAPTETLLRQMAAASILTWTGGSRTVMEMQEIDPSAAYTQRLTPAQIVEKLKRAGITLHRKDDEPGVGQP